MPVMFGFATQRRQILEAELERFVQEMPPLGMQRMWVVGDLARGRVSAVSNLELVLVQDTDEPWRRRPDFWNMHLRPRVGTQFYVFTNEELERMADDDPLLRQAMNHGEPVHG
ncbi:MAG: hypothetical protein WD208_13290 [Dehalococcoidia bacterium]